MARTIEEVRQPGPVPFYRHPEWSERFPWLVQGTTGRKGGEPEFDLGAFGDSPIGATLDRWNQLRALTRTRTALHARQVHGSAVGVWERELPSGLFFTDGLDAHLTDRAGLLLAVSVADCVPVFLVDEGARWVGLVHAGWRGVAAGIVEATLSALSEHGVPARDLWLHCGPSICGACYEVGPEVHAAVSPEREPPPRPAPIDLRAAIAGRARQAGVPEERITLSAHCTRCGPGSFFSHRAGSSGRQMGVIARVA